MAPTLMDVAQLCGADVQTVRRVLSSGLVDISTEDIRMILETAKEAGYDRRQPSLGIIYAEESRKGLEHPFFALILNAFKQEAEAHGYNITFINTNSAAAGGSCLEQCLLSHVDGVCLVCVDFENPEIKELVKGDLPCLTIDHLYRRVPAVLSDNESGVCKLVEYAIRQGHSRIAFVHGHNNSIVTRTRIHQFQSVMDFYNLPVPPEYMREGLYHDIELTRRIVKELLTLPERPTCILLPDDISYLGAQSAAWELNLRIPNEISFAGYDCIPLSQELKPKLTTIRQSSDRMGREAARRLIGFIENPQTATLNPSIFSVDLIEGETVAKLTS